MENGKSERRVKDRYVAPKVLATYTREELKETIRPHGPQFGYGGCGCSCGCGIP